LEHIIAALAAFGSTYFQALLWFLKMWSELLSFVTPRGQYLDFRFSEPVKNWTVIQ